MSLPVISPPVIKHADVDPGVDLHMVARAAGRGTTAKMVRRALEAVGGRRSVDGGAVLTLSLTDAEADAAMGASAETVAVATAKVLRLGVYAPPRRAPAPPPTRRERPMGTQNHPWKRGDGGRAIRSAASGHQIATLLCRCGNKHDIGFRQLAGSDQIDRKFIQAGWTLDPSRCPVCNPNHKDRSMSANPSPAAIRSQATMFRLLGEHFDIDAGRYGDGWSDDRIAKETSLSAAMVAGVRTEAFGPIKEPEEIAALARDIATLDGMFVEAAATVETIKTDLGALKERMAEIRRKFAA